MPERAKETLRTDADGLFLAELDVDEVRLRPFAPARTTRISSRDKREGRGEGCSLPESTGIGVAEVLNAKARLRRRDAPGCQSPNVPQVGQVCGCGGGQF